MFDHDCFSNLSLPSVMVGFALLTAYCAMAGEPHTHAGSQRNLIGGAPSEELVAQLSNEKQVTAQTPPAFLFHTDEDKAVPAENSIAFYQACAKRGSSQILTAHLELSIS